MPPPTRPPLELGRVYRTRDLAQWARNPPRLAKRLVREGLLVRLGPGLFVHPKRGRFGTVPPTDHEIMRAFLQGSPFVFTGPYYWNALGLGSTSLSAEQLVYNTQRSGTFDFGGSRFVLRRVAFPVAPPPEWFVVDLLEHAEQAGVARPELMTALRRAVQKGRFSPDQLRATAERFGSKGTQALVESALPAEP